MAGLSKCELIGAQGLLEMPEEKLTSTSSYDTDHPENRSAMINSSDIFIVMQMQSFLEDARWKFHDKLSSKDPSIRLKAFKCRNKMISRFRKKYSEFKKIYLIAEGNVHETN